MKLKYYLRGLGLGLIVAAIVLGVHNSRTGKMSDADIIKRAEQLGMVENTTLTASNDKTAEELLNEIDEKDEKTDDVTDIVAAEETPDINEAENAEDEEIKEEISEEDTADVEAEEKVVELENTRADAVTDAEDDPDKPAVIQEAEEVKPEITVSTEPETEEAPEAPTVNNNVEGASIQIVRGDTSTSVAKKLEKAGIILDAAEYDRYLCTNGYDRSIVCGEFVIPETYSNEDIAKLITGKM